MQTEQGAKLIITDQPKTEGVDVVTPDLNPTNTHVTTNVVNDFVHDYILHPEDQNRNHSNSYLVQSTII